MATAFSGLPQFPASLALEEDSLALEEDSLPQIFPRQFLPWVSAGCACDSNCPVKFVLVMQHQEHEGI